ncbi:DUF3102 domain-containing protein [Acinetobacter puyangensis]|uniref:DUF3102 domain-containing protein n=1 Tax=Acinetobacter puyangensis TaxID=1096779 RepID=UPI003A4E51EB
MDIEQTQEIAISEHARNLGMLAAQLGYEGSLALGALEDEVRFFQQRTVESCMEIGKRLLLIKEQTPHGEFNKRIEILNFTPRMAQKFMSAVLKFSKTNSSSLLQKAGNQTKLLELVMLDDDEIELLDQGGSIGDVNLDSIETMSVRELKQALREARANDEAKDKLIQSKDQKINKLDTELNKSNSQAQILKKQETEQQQLTASALDTLHSACLTMHNDVVRFTNAINSIQAAIEEHGLYNIQEQLEANVVAAFQQIAQTSVELAIQIDFTEMVNPSWMPQVESDASHFDATDVEQ